MAGQRDRPHEAARSGADRRPWVKRRARPIRQRSLDVRAVGKAQAPLTVPLLRRREARSWATGADCGDGTVHHGNVSGSDRHCNGNEMSNRIFAGAQKRLQLSQSFGIERAAALGDRQLAQRQRLVQQQRRQRVASDEVQVLDERSAVAA